MELDVHPIPTGFPVSKNIWKLWGMMFPLLNFQIKIIRP